MEQDKSKSASSEKQPQRKNKKPASEVEGTWIKKSKKAKSPSKTVLPVSVASPNIFL